MPDRQAGPSTAARVAELLFPHVTQTPQDILAQFPARRLPPGAWVTRFAPSPTGFIHIGGIFSALVSKRLAHQTGGVFFLRIEDTDKKREVESGVKEIVENLLNFDLKPDEGPVQVDPIAEAGAYGPYTQSRRADIYAVFAKDLVARGLAYPCFCSPEELEAIRQAQAGSRVKPGYYGPWAKDRDLALEQIEDNLAKKPGFVIRFRAPYPAEDKVQLDDLIRGRLEFPDNDQDAVLLKSDGLPTYHLAHVVDDALMGTSLIIRGDEWIPSVPLHLQLFRAMNLPLPKFGHVAPIAKMDGSSRRKLSKRKDPEAAVSYYYERGYPAQSVIEYLLNLANSDFEDWRRRNPDAPYTDFELKIGQMASSNALFDLQKLNDISKNIIARYSAATVYDLALAWAQRYDPRLAALLRRDVDYALAVFGVERTGPAPRKDIVNWSDVERACGFFFDELYEEVAAGGYPWPAVEPDTRRSVLAYCIEQLPALGDRDSWLQDMRQFAESLGFAKDTKTYKSNPGLYKGNWGDVMMVLRVALAAKQFTPDLYAVITTLGTARAVARLRRAMN